MNSIDKPQNLEKSNSFLWVLIAILIIAGVVANYYFASVAWPLRLSGWIILAIIIVFLGSKTAAGKKLWQFAKEARVELRKVVWPTKDETIRNTTVIVLIVIFTAFILWCIDTLLLMAVNWIVVKKRGLNMSDKDLSQDEAKQQVEAARLMRQLMLREKSGISYTLIPGKNRKLCNASRSHKAFGNGR